VGKKTLYLPEQEEMPSTEDRFEMANDVGIAQADSVRRPHQTRGKIRTPFGSRFLFASSKRSTTRTHTTAPSLRIRVARTFTLHRDGPSCPQVTYGLNKRNRPEEKTSHERREVAQMAGRSERGSEKAQFKARPTHTDPDTESTLILTARSMVFPDTASRSTLTLSSRATTPSFSFAGGMRGAPRTVQRGDV